MNAEPFDDDAVYGEDETRIFNYIAGPKTGPVCADPYELLRDMTVALGGGINGVLAEWRCEDEVASAIAAKRLVDATRTAFQMDPFDRTQPHGGYGATSGEVLEVLLSFLQFLNQKKSKPSDMLIPPAGSPELSQQSSPGGNFPMASGSASG